MASNIFGRYIWFIDILRCHKRLTFEEINNIWFESGLSYGEGDDLPLRTFYNHRKAIQDIFDVYIECNSLDYLCDQLGISERTHHRSGDDTKICARLFLQEIKDAGRRELMGMS